MQRLQTAVAACCNDPSIRVVLDINPDHWENLAYINAALPGEFLAHDRIKELFRQRNVKYFAVDEVSEAFELQSAVEDFVVNNTVAGERFVLMLDRNPINLPEILGPTYQALAGCYV